MAFGSLTNPDASPTPQRWIFDHLTRTGGTSVFAALATVPGAAAVRQLNNGTSADDAERVLAGAVRIVGGHLGFAPGHVLKPGIGYLTFLRDPVERAVSVYLHARHHERPVPGTYVDHAQSVSLEAFVCSDDPEVRLIISNYYTRHFASALLDNGAMGDKAARRLAQYHFVGLFDRLEESLLLFDALNGWSRSGPLPALNASKERRPALSDRIRARLAKINELDLALWEQAQALYAERLRGFLRRAPRIAAHSAGADGVTPAPDVGGGTLPAPEGVRFGNEQIKIVVADTVRADVPVSEFQSGEAMTVRLTLFSHVAAEDVTVGIAILDLARRVIFGTNTALLGCSFTTEPNHEYRCDFTVGLDIGAGEYSIQAAVHTGLEHTENCFDWVEPAVKFAVAGFRGTPFAGVANLPCTAGVSAVGAGRPLSDFRGDLTLDDARASRIRVRNDGAEPWPHDGPLPVHVSYRWLDAAGEIMPIEGERFVLPRRLAPGSTAIVDLALPDPPPDAATCRVTLVQELVAWFDQCGGPSVDLPVQKHERAPAARAATVIGK